MAENVLHNPDLLYQILLLLPQRDLLMSQRVCAIWRHIIISSRKLQVILFFLPDIDEPPVSSIRASNIPDQHQIQDINPLLQERFPDFFDSSTFWKYSYKGCNLGPWKSTHWFRGKCCVEVPRPGHPNWRRSRFSESPEESWRAMIQDEQRLKAYARPEASWRRMIPFKPMPKELQVYLACRWPLTDRGVLKCLHFSNRVCERDGSTHKWLTFGLFYDTIEQAWFRPPQENHYFLAKFNFPYAYVAGCEEKSTGNYDLRRLRTACPDLLGGPSRLLIQFYKENGRPSHINVRRPGTPTEPLIHEYMDWFKSSDLSLTDIQWDDEIELPSTRVVIAQAPGRLERTDPKRLVLVLNN